jgi:carboxylesterase type B
LELSDRKGWITAREVARSSSSFKKHKLGEIRSLFHELEQMGMAKLDGKGTKLKLSSLSSPVVKVSSKDDDNNKSPNNTSSSHFSSPVVTNSGLNSGETVVSKNNSGDTQPDDDKTKTVVSENNIEPTMPTMTTKSTQKQSQQGIEFDDSLTTEPSTGDDKTMTDDSAVGQS